MRLLHLVVVVAALCVHASADPLQDPDVEIAKRHMDAGDARYHANDYEGALEEFRRAERVYKRPEFEFNIARCLDRLERFPEALAEYELYLAQRPNDPRVGARVTTLRERLAAEAPAVRPASGRRSFPRAAVAVGASGLAVAVLGAALVGSVKPDYDAVRASCPRSCPESRWGSLRTRADVGYAALGVGAGTIAVDAALWALWAHHRPVADRAALRPLLGPTSLGLMGRF